MNPNAEKLNAILAEQAPSILAMLSRRGKEISFPHNGILGQTAQAKGKRFNATIGIALEEDGSPMRLKSIEQYVNVKPSDVYPYAPSFGKKELRETWQKMIREKNTNIASPMTMPVVTAGLTHALTVAGSMFLDEGDAVILPDLFWGNYRLIFEHQYGAKLKTFPTFRNGGFDTMSLREALANGPAGKRVLLLNFPNNPTGYTPTTEEAWEIVKIIGEAAKQGNSIVVLLDDAYFGLCFEQGTFTESLFGELAGLHPNVLPVKIDGATKEDYVWGHRVGFITYGHGTITPDVATVLEDKTAGTVRASVSNSSHLSQSLLLLAYQSPEYFREKRAKEEILKTRYEAVKEAVWRPEYRAYFEPLPFNSGYFMCIRLAEGLQADTIRKTLLQDFDTGVIATGNLVRIAFSSIPTADIPQLFKNIAAACAAHMPAVSQPIPVPVYAASSR